MKTPARTLALAVILTSALFASAAFAATITIVNNDGAGEGFNDPTVVAPVGGNPGTTVGAQRLYVFQYAANIWGSILPSSVVIQVRSAFNPLTCTATSATLGSAGPTTIHRDFAGAPFAGTWYYQSLANRLNGTDLSAANPDINATFSSSLDGGTCLGGQTWYYGTDGLEGTKVELLPVVLHEIGLGSASAPRRAARRATSTVASRPCSTVSCTTMSRAVTGHPSRPLSGSHQRSLSTSWRGMVRP